MKSNLTHHAKRSGLKLFTLFFALLFIVSSCNQGEEENLAPVEDLPELTAALENFDEEVEYTEYYVEGESNARWKYKRWKRKPTFFTLVSALNYTGLLRTVIKQKLTIFAPDDRAFSKLGLNFWNIRNLDKEVLTNILLSHVVEGFVFSDMLPECSAQTINNSSIGIITNDGITLKDNSDVPINLLFTDRRALRSVFHGIDKVLELDVPMKNIAEIAIENGSFTQLVAALEKTGLVSAIIAPEANLTVFAPIDQAFFNFYDNNSKGFESIDEIPEEILSAILLHHVVDSRAFSYCLSNGPLGTLNGDIFVDLDNLQLISSGDNTVGLIVDPFLLDIQATNGVIHVINDILIPSEVAMALEQ